MVQQIESGTDRLILTMDFSRMTPEQVFDTFIMPETLTQWWPPKAVIDPRAGGTYDLIWPRQEWHLRGTYGDFVRGQRLTFTWHWDHEANLPIRHVEISFAPQGIDTRLTLTHGFYTPADAEERQGHLDGWLYFLDRLSNLQP